MCKCFNMQVVHRHGLSRVSCVVSLHHVSMFQSALVHRHGRGKRLGTCLVFELCASCAMSLQHVSMFDCAGCALAWTKHVPRYVPSVRLMCHDHCCMHD